MARIATIATIASPKPSRAIPADSPFPELFAQIAAFVATAKADWKPRLAASLRDIEAAYHADNVDALVVSAGAFMELSQAYYDELKARLDAQEKAASA